MPSPSSVGQVDAHAVAGVCDCWLGALSPQAGLASASDAFVRLHPTTAGAHLEQPIAARPALPVCTQSSTDTQRLAQAARQHLQRLGLGQGGTERRAHAYAQQHPTAGATNPMGGVGASLLQQVREVLHGGRGQRWCPEAPGLPLPNPSRACDSRSRSCCAGAVDGSALGRAPGAAGPRRPGEALEPCGGACVRACVRQGCATCTPAPWQAPRGNSWAACLPTEVLRARGVEEASDVSRALRHRLSRADALLAASLREEGRHAARRHAPRGRRARRRRATKTASGECLPLQPCQTGGRGCRWRARLRRALVRPHWVLALLVPPTFPSKWCCTHHH